MIADTEILPFVEAVLKSRELGFDGTHLVERDGTLVPLPDVPQVDDLADLPSALPSRARGDLREKTLYNIVQDLGGLAPKQRLKDKALKDALDGSVGTDRSSRQVLSAVMKRQYWVVPTRREGATGSPFVTPFHTLLPGAYDYHGRYKSFRGSLLLFISWNGRGFDLEATNKLVDFLGSGQGLTLLDREFLRVATELVESSGAQLPAPEARRLEDEFGERIRERFSAGAFDLPGLQRIREDLVTILDLPLPRHDKVAALVQGLSIDLALYYYRLAYTLGEGIVACISVADGAKLPERPDFAGRLLFRVGTGGDRPVRMDEPCSQAFLELDGKHLLSLPASMATSNLLARIGAAAGAVEGDGPPDPYGLAESMQSHPMRRRVDALAAAVAVLVAAEADDPGAAVDRAMRPGSGCLALQEAVLQNFRSRGSTLKQRGRDVVHTLVGGYVGGLKRSRGPVNFFELDEPVLFLLVELILGRSGKKQLQFRSAFLPQLADYGLSPQDRREEDRLAVALERLGMLRRYSDAGEALYVRRSR